MATDPKQQKAFDTVLKQGLGAMTSPELSQRIATDARRDPVRALHDAVLQVLKGVRDAAAQAGTEIPGDVMQAAAVAMVQVMAALMVESGFAKDPGELTRAVVQQLKEQ